MFENSAQFICGNVSAVSEERAKYREWSFGDFVQWTKKQGEQLSIVDAKDRFGLRYSDALEVKWSHHQAGDFRPGGWAGFGKQGGFTLGILVSGGFLVQFRKADDAPVKDVRLSEKGDFVAWESSVFDHTWKALRDSDFLTIRWWDGDHLRVSEPAV